MMMKYILSMALATALAINVGAHVPACDDGGFGDSGTAPDAAIIDYEAKTGNSA